MNRLAFLPLGLALLAAGLLPAQGVVFTGEVSLDFPPHRLHVDPDGLEVGMPDSLQGQPCGWDIEHLGVSYEAATDVLWVGIDSAGVAGDPDGDGDPDSTSAALAALGGSDLPQWAGTETFTFCLDLDADGAFDVIVGLPFGADASGLMTSFFSGPQGAPFGGFGAPLPPHAPVGFQVPDAGHPDVEFGIPAFSVLLAGFAAPGQTSIGVHAFMGSLEDAGVGEDSFPGFAPMPLAIDDLPCLPLINHFSAAGPQVPVDNGVLWTTCYGLPQGYGACILASLWDHPAGTPMTTIPGIPVLRLGVPGDLSTVFAADLGTVTNGTGPILLQQATWYVPATIPSGTRIHLQMYAYPGGGLQAGLPLPHLASRRLTFEQP